jgi:hypothetical protein
MNNPLLTPEDFTKAMRRELDRSARLRRDIAKVQRSGYKLDSIEPTPTAAMSAAMLGRRITPIPHFVKVSGG